MIPPYFIFDHHNMPAIFWGFELPFDLFGLLNLHLAIFNKINTLHYFSIRQNHLSHTNPLRFVLDCAVVFPIHAVDWATRELVSEAWAHTCRFWSQSPKERVTQSLSADAAAVVLRPSYHVAGLSWLFPLWEGEG